MHVNPLPGVDRDNLLKTLRELQTQVRNLRGQGAGQSSGDWLVGQLLAYFEWANGAERMLRSLIRTNEAEALVRTRKHDHLLSQVGRSQLAHVPAVAGLLALELDEREAAFNEIAKRMERRVMLWSGSEAFALLDTNVYVHHTDKIMEFDLHAELGMRGNDIRVLLPMVVVDELDNLKDRGSNDVRGRARRVLRLLDKLLTEPVEPVRLRPADFSALDSGGIPRGEISIEMLFDPPGHQRLPMNDDEIVDRIVATQPLAGRPITLVTYDTGLALRARAAGVQVKKLSEEIGR